MKILLAHNSYQEPGGENVVFEQERQLLERNGHRVITYKRSNHELNDLSALGRISLLKNIVSAKGSKNEIGKILRSETPDLVHVHNTFMMISPSIYEACQHARVPVLQTLHNYRLFCPALYCYREGHVCEECTEHSLVRGVWHGCYRGSSMATAVVALMLQIHRTRGTWTDAIDGYITPTVFSRSKFIDAGLPASKIHMKPNFVDQDPGARTYPGHYALFVGRLSPEKGVLTLLDAWERLPTNVPLVIVGDGPLRGHLESEVEKRNLRDIHFKGWLRHDEVQMVMKKAAFLVFPKRLVRNLRNDSCGSVCMWHARAGIPPRSHPGDHRGWPDRFAFRSWRRRRSCEKSCMGMGAF